MDCFSDYYGDAEAFYEDHFDEFEDFDEAEEYSINNTYKYYSFKLLYSINWSRAYRFISTE